MSDNETAETKKRPPHRFKPGQSGNPSGRPKGSRAEAFAILDNMAAEAAERVVQALVAKAEEGDPRAAELLLRRAWPERKGRPLPFKVPSVAGATGLVAAMEGVTAAMAAGEMTPEEATAVAGVLEVHRKAIQAEEFDARLKALEDGRT